MEVRKAKEEDLENVIEFYSVLIDEMKDHPYRPRWKKGVYPDKIFLSNAIAMGELYIAREDAIIISSLIITPKFSKSYNDVKWSVDVSDNEIFTLHAFAVSPKLQKSGVGRFMLNEAFKIAKENGGKVIRLDVLSGTLNAERLYQSVGFIYIGKYDLYYKDTGLAKFSFYEKIL